MSTKKAKTWLIQEVPDNVVEAIVFYFNSAPHVKKLAGTFHGYRVDVTRSAVDVYRRTYQPDQTQVLPFEKLPGADGRVVIPEEEENMKVPDGIAEDKPSCPNHYLTMEYDPAKALWSCPNYQCTQTARKRLTIDQTSAQVIKSDLRIYCTGDGTGDKDRFLLYLRAFEVFLDITDTMNRDASGTMHGGDSYHLGMDFPNLNAEKKL